MLNAGSWLLLIAVAIPLAASLMGRGRRSAVTAAASSAFCVLIAAWPWLLARQSEPGLFTLGPGSALLRVDAMSALPMVVFSALVLGVVIAAPRSDGEASGHAGTLLLLSGALLTYGAGNSLVLFAGWTLTALPLLTGKWVPEHGAEVPRRLPAIMVGSSVVLLGFGLLSMTVLRGGVYAFGLVVLAAIVRKGLFPFHGWVVTALAAGPLLPFGLLVNAHLGAFVIARVAIPTMPDLSRDALTLLSSLALISALYSAFAGLGERNPRRSLALLMISQSSFILAGLESRSTEGIAGALTFWLVVSVATMGLLIVYRALEKRCADLAEIEYAGLAASAPRMSVFFAICGLALVGLPGTLGFAAEDLLFQGALTGHPLLGVALPLATALNAYNVFRLFSSLFFGRRTTLVPVFPDALARERVVLSAVVLFLILGGIAPGLVISSRVASAEGISVVLSGSNAGNAGH